MLFFSHRHHHDFWLTPPLLFESVARYCIIMLGSGNELYRENENKSNLAPPSMISQLTTLAAQTLEGSLLLYWKTSAHGTNGNLQKTLKASIVRNLIPKSKTLLIGKSALPAPSKKARIVANGSCQHPRDGRFTSTRFHETFPDEKRKMSKGGIFACQREVGEQQCGELQLLPLWLQLQHRLDESSTSAPSSLSKLNLIDHLLPQMRCSVILGSGSPLPTTSSPSRGLLSPTTPPDFPPVLFN